MVLTKAMFIVIAIVYPLGWLATAFEGDKRRNLSKTRDLRTIAVILLIFAVIFMFAAYRHITGPAVDEYAYRNRIISYRTMSLKKAFKMVEIFSTLPTWVLSRMTHNTQAIIIFCSFVTYFIFIYCIKNYCDNFELGIILLFFLNIVNYSFNAMQQVEAAAVLLLGLPYLYKRDFKKYLIVVIAASLIHLSSLIMIALYFIVNIKPWSAKFIGVAMAFVAVMVLFNSVFVPLVSRIGIYENYSSVLAAGGGVKLITVVVAFVPIGMALVFKRHLPDDDKELNCLINLTMIYAMIYLVSFRQRFVARFAIFLLPFLLPYYTKLVTLLRKERLSLIVYYILVMGYGATTIYFTRSLGYTFMLEV